MRKFGRIEAPVESVHSLFVDFAEWPQWVPGVSSCRILEQHGDRTVAAIEQEVHGFQVPLTVEFVVTPEGFRQRQLRGRARSWLAVWTFSEPPDGDGTTVSSDLEIDLGWAGRLVPRSLIQSSLDQAFRQTLEHARQRLPEVSAAALEPGAVPKEAILLEVWRVPSGLEIRVGRRTFAIPI